MTKKWSSQTRILFHSLSVLFQSVMPWVTRVSWIEVEKKEESDDRQWWWCIPFQEMSVKSLREILSSLTFDKKERISFPTKSSDWISWWIIICTMFLLLWSLLYFVLVSYSFSLFLNWEATSDQDIDTRDYSFNLPHLSLLYSSLSNLKVISFLYTMKFTCKNLSALPAETDVRQSSQEMMMMVNWWRFFYAVSTYIIDIFSSQRNC